LGKEFEIAMLWGRGELSFLEQLCIRSFLDSGHHVALYSYGPVGRVPEGVEARDAAAILPETLAGESTGAPGLHADLFRYRLLERTERTIWTDTDVCCLRRFDPAQGHFHGWESAEHVSGGVLALPRDSATLGSLLDFTRDPFAIPPWETRRVRKMLARAAEAGDPVPAGVRTWGDWGSKALTHFLRETGEIAHALPQAALFPLSLGEWRKLLRPGVDASGSVSGDTLSVHLYGRRVRSRLAGEEVGLPDPESLLGQLLRKHRIDPCEAPLPDRPDPDRDHPFARAFREAAEGKTHAAAAPGMRPLNDVVAVTAIRNEGAFLLDWVAYHLSVGVTHFLVYTNDCDDPTEAILGELAKRGLVTRIDNPVLPGERPLRQALADAPAHFRVRTADAVVVLDVDEYINVHAGEGTLADLFAAAGDPDLISMTRRLFGTSGHIAFEDIPVAERFTRAAPHLTRKPHPAWGFRTILRRGAPFAGLGAHRPQEPTTDVMPRWTNGSGRQLPDRYLEGGWRSGIDCWGYDLVTLNHYAIRSAESFLVKRDRVRPDPAARSRDVAYWNTFNRNDEADVSILPRLDRARAVRRGFADDPVLGPLHEEAVAWHKARIAELRASPREGALFAALAADPLSHAVSEADLPAPEAAAGLVLRAEPPATGRAAAEQFEGLMSRVRKRQDMLDPQPNPPRSEKITVVTSMKNEGCFILEWVAYHLSIGVTHFLVYTNDCDDPTDAILDRLAEMGLATRLDNPFNREAGQKPQRGALNDAAERLEVTDADWVGVIDVDEFVNIHVGDGTFAALLDAANQPNVVSMTWRFFGNLGVHAFEDRWQTEQFTACAPLYIPKPRLGWGFKSFYRPDGPFAKIGVHRPLDLDPEREAEVRWVNGAGRVMPERVARKAEWFSRKDTIGYDMVTLNHYVLRSAESFLVKRERGRINHVDQDQGTAYWASRNYATETDLSIHRHLPRAREALARLLADEALFRLHLDAVAWHRGRIDALMAEPDYRALYDAITDPALPDAIWRERVPDDPDTALEAAE
jgi:hypothetical protein